MGSFFRSEEIDLYCLLIPREGAYNLMSYLGKRDQFHFLDADPNVPSFNRLYSKQSRRCEDLLKQVQEIGTIMNQFGYEHGLGKGDISNFLDLLEIKKKTRKQDQQYYIDELEKEISTTLIDMKKQIETAKEIRTKMNIMVEEKACLENILPLTKQTRQDQTTNLQQIKSDDLQGQSSSTKMGRIIGSINIQDTIRFEKFMFRATKGKCYMHVQPIETGGTRYKIVNPLQPTEEIRKSCFLFMYNASQLLENKLMRICHSFNANMFRVQEDIESVREGIENNNNNYQKSKELLNLTYKYLEQQFNRLQNQTDDITLLEQYRLTLLHEKQIYHHINLTKNTGGRAAVLKAIVYLPKSEEDNIIQYLHDSSDPKYATPQLHSLSKQDAEKYKSAYSIPTKIKSNEFLDVFQEIVNTYGTPRYREINPGLFTVVTFPFLFGVMFGDIGHGILLLIMGIYLMLSYDKKIHQNDGLYRGRYIISMMGFFATFCGFIYNDFMSIPLDLFGSCYDKKQKNILMKSDKSCVYPFGIDPVWLNSQNSLTYFNSFKMKTSIIFGIAQMTLGIFLKGINSILNSNMIDFFFEFLPQLIFLSSTFGYMVLLIILKWLSNFNVAKDAPSILNIMLNFPLKLGQLDNKEIPLLGYFDITRTQQETIQFSLLIIAILAIPMMLLPKPIILYYQNKKKTMKTNHHEITELEENDDFESQQLINKTNDNLIDDKIINKNNNNTNNNNNNIKDHDESDDSEEIISTKNHHDFGEIFVHQIIESIEFVLGSISHTASYLRLWALSLAHSQLAAVFFEKTLLDPIKDSSIIGLIIGFFMFALITFAVLMCMDVMECFLHTLRLHWVEFQSKFYKADGVLFSPLSFHKTLTQNNLEALQN